MRLRSTQQGKDTLQATITIHILAKEARKLPRVLARLTVDLYEGDLSIRTTSTVVCRMWYSYFASGVLEYDKTPIFLW